MKPMKTEAIDTQLLQVRDFGEWLMSRDTGSKVCRELEERLARGGADAVIDFTGVQAMTFSFADEFIGRFMSMREAELVGSVGVILSGLNEDTAETATLVLERRHLIAVCRVGEDLRLLGADEYLEETFTTASLLDDFKAAELAEQLQISPQNANNRLKRLVAAGAVRRTRSSAGRGGKEFTYKVVR
jgi:hypothetical protein